MWFCNKKIYCSLAVFLAALIKEDPNFATRVIDYHKPQLLKTAPDKYNNLETHEGLYRMARLTYNSIVIVDGGQGPRHDATPEPEDTHPSQSVSNSAIKSS